MITLASVASAAETSLKAGAGLKYKYDDNIRATPQNQIALAGWIVDGNASARYATDRLQADATLKLSSEDYNHIDTDDLQPGLAEPKTSDFNSDNQDFLAGLAYGWERHRLSLNGRYWRDSTLNTQFLDTGLGGLAQIEGATRQVSSSLRPEWQWQWTERQSLHTLLEWRTVDYDSALYVDYDYSIANFSWSYLLSERLHLQVVPQYSLYENESAASVRSETYGLQAGVIWVYSEQLNFDVLLGATEVRTEIDGGFFTFDFENFEIVFVEFEDQTNNGFTGNFNATYTEEKYRLAFNVYSRYTPSADGGLREDSQARFTAEWRPLERMQLDLDARYGISDSAESVVNRGREYGEAGIRLGYRLAREWWLSASYRYRTQEYDNSRQGAGESNTLTASISYRLPKEIL